MCVVRLGRAVGRKRGRRRSKPHENNYTTPLLHSSTWAAATTRHTHTGKSIVGVRRGTGRSVDTGFLDVTQPSTRPPHGFAFLSRSPPKTRAASVSLASTLARPRTLAARTQQPPIFLPALPRRPKNIVVVVVERIPHVVDRYSGERLWAYAQCSSSRLVKKKKKTPSRGGDEAAAVRCAVTERFTGAVVAAIAPVAAVRA